jgi:hypothetical protein
MTVYPQPDSGGNRKRIRQGGKVCSTCGQYAMLFELRDHGRACSYCTPVPDTPEGEAIMDSTHNLALDEDRRRRRAARRSR